MPEKLQAMFASRRFWVAVAGVLVVVLQELGMPIAEDHVQMIVLVLASWIVGDSIRSTGGAFPAAVLLACVLSIPAMADDAHDLCRAATVRVRNGSSLGTGTAFRASGDYIYVLTNAHVAGTRLGTRVECEFWRAGHQSSPVAGETVVVAYVPRAYRDIAVVRIDRRLLRGYLPAIIPIANPDEQADYRRLFSVGCASGRWPTAFEGFALRRNASGGDTVHFVPAPAGGRSGSALFDVEGNTPRIVGLVAWRSSDNGGHGLDGRGEKHGYGIAMTHHEVWAGLRGERQSISLAAPNDAIPVQHTEPDKTKAETGERSVLKQPSPPAAPLETGSSSDVILLYSDPVAIGPNPEPPAVGGCEDGRCLPPQDPPGDPLFPSLPDDLGGSPDTPTPSMPASRDWLPWAIAIAAVIVLVGRPLLRVPGAAVDWFASRIEQRLQTHAQAAETNGQEGMSDLLEKGQQWLADQLTTRAAQTVVYARDGDEVSAPATIGQTTFEHDDGQGTVIRTQVRDYLIDANKLVLAGQLTQPKPGDQIRETAGDTTFTYEVMAIAGEPCWRYSDPFRIKLRIHTKLISEEPST